MRKITRPPMRGAGIDSHGPYPTFEYPFSPPRRSLRFGSRVPRTAMPLPSPSQDPSGGKDFVKQSSLYQEFLAEREEILRHKWLESERLGYDIGFERALLDWIRKHRDSWRAARRAHQPYSSGKSMESRVTAAVSPFSGGLGNGSGHHRKGDGPH
jgi:hypothetical protein